jgi:hypothetical protein
VQARGDAFAFHILDISLGGLRLAGAAPAEPGTPVTVGLGRFDIHATIVRGGTDEFAVRFDRAAGTRVDLIRFVYSGRYSAAVPRIKPLQVAAAVVGRVMR